MKKLLILSLFLSQSFVFGQKYLIPMDGVQTDHLKAYGIVHMVIKKGITVEWFLNYRGGSFVMDTHDFIAREGILRGVLIENVIASEYFSGRKESNRDPDPEECEPFLTKFDQCKTLTTIGLLRISGFLTLPLVRPKIRKMTMFFD